MWDRINFERMNAPNGQPEFEAVGQNFIHFPHWVDLNKTPTAMDRIVFDIPTGHPHIELAGRTP